jgi:ATP-dependent Clp endopeptidase proteolytic subunit ClpP
MSQTDIYIYSQIGQGGITAESIRKKVANAGDEITVHINSPGGEVYEGYTIYNILRNSGKKITVVIEGLCASIATLIACSGDRIVMNPTAEFMIHNPMVGIEGDAEDLRKVADQLDNIKKTIIQAYKRKTNKSEEELWDMMNRETFLSAVQAKDFGFVDEVEQSLRVVAYLDVTKIKSDRTMDQKILDAINSLGARIDGLFKSKPKNMGMTLQDGTQIMIETENENELTEKAVFVQTEQGMQPAPDGEHTLADGRVIVVAGGMIKEVKEAQAAQDQPEDVAALKAEIENLKTQLAASEESRKNEAQVAQTVKAENETIKAELTEIKNQFEGIRKMTIGNDKPPIKNQHQNDKGKGANYFDNVAQLIKTRKQ